MLVFQNKEMAAVMVEQTNPPGIELCSFVSVIQYGCWSPEWKHSIRADLHGTIFVACDNGLRQTHDMIYDCCVRQKKCRSI